MFYVLSVEKNGNLNFDRNDFSRPRNMVIIFVSLSLSIIHNVSYTSKMTLLSMTGGFLYFSWVKFVVVF